MSRVLAVATIFLMLSVAACGSDGSGREQGADTAGGAFAGDPTPAIIPAPSATAVDFTKECGLPLSEQYCAARYRPPPPSCPVSQPARLTLGGKVGTGGPLVWMLGAPIEGFGPAVLSDIGTVKTLWIVSDDVTGEVKISGKRLDGPGRIVFPLYDRDPLFYEQRGAGTYELRWDRTELTLIPPHGVVGQDHTTQVFYPSAGCWQFTAEIGTEKVQIVRYLYETE